LMLCIDSLPTMSPASFFVKSNLKPASLSSLALILVGAAFLYILCLAGYAIFNVYFHPLCRFPGPKSWIVFPFLYRLSSVRGLLDKNMRSFHEKYGEVVRLSPSSLRKPGKTSMAMATSSSRRGSSETKASHPTSSLQTTKTIRASEKRCPMPSPKRLSEIKNRC
jgi:hypothetical protein